MLRGVEVKFLFTSQRAERVSPSLIWVVVLAGVIIVAAAAQILGFIRFDGVA